MALFTSEQANACVIDKCTSIKSDGVHQYWFIQVTDGDGFPVEWNDHTCAVDATDADLKTAMHNYLTTQEEKRPATSPVITEDENTGIEGETVG